MSIVESWSDAVTKKDYIQKYMNDIIIYVRLYF